MYFFYFILRRGHSLSPYLFIVGVGVLSHLLLSDEEGLIHGFKVTRNAPSVSHLIFADDSFLFCKANLNEAREIRDILESYCQMSGQLVNYRKSAALLQ